MKIFWVKVILFTSVPRKGKEMNMSFILAVLCNRIFKRKEHAYSLLYSGFLSKLRYSESKQDSAKNLGLPGMTLLCVLFELLMKTQAPERAICTCTNSSSLKWR